MAGLFGQRFDDGEELMKPGRVPRDKPHRLRISALELVECSERSDAADTPITIVDHASTVLLREKDLTGSGNQTERCR